MNEYLIQILKVENTVIIPGLGALMVTNSKTGAVMFNPHLKFNDKTLEKYVEENSNMDAQEASNFVAKFSNEINSQLDKGESYDIFGLGKFVKNGEEIEFLQETEGSKPAPAPKKEAPKPAVEEPKTEKKEDTVEKTTTEANEEKIIPVVTPVEKPKEKLEPVGKSESNNEKPKNTYTEPKKDEKPVNPPIDKEQTSSEKKPSLTKEEKAKKTEDLKKAGVKPTKTMEKTKKDKKPKKKKGLKIFLLLLLLLLIGGGVYIGIFWKERYQYVFGFAEQNEIAQQQDANGKNDENNHKETADSEQETVVAEEDTADSLNNEETMTNIEETVQEEEPVEEVTVAEESPEVKEEPVKVVESSTSFESNGSRGGNGDYHVVVGLFQNPANADGLVAKLKGEGHAATILGTFDGLQMVVVKSFPSRDAAISSMREIRSTIEDRAWVFKY